MLTIKLKKIGKKHQPAFRAIVTEKRSKLNGKFVEDIGYWNPHSDQFSLKKERVEHWLKVGAQPTDSLHNLLVRAEIIKGPKIPVHSSSKKSAQENKAGNTTSS